MGLQKKTILKEKFYEKVFSNEDQYPLSAKDESLSFLISFFDDIRPSRKKNNLDAEQNLLDCISFIEDHPVIAFKLQQAILVQLVNTDLKTAFAKSGIPGDDGFLRELVEKLKHKILEPLQDKNDFLYVINRIFYDKSDWQWVSAIKRATWIHFFELLQFTIQASDKRLRQQLMDALTFLSYQVANSGLDEEITAYISPFKTDHENPFIVQNLLLQEFQKQITDFPLDVKAQANKLKISLLEIENEIDYIKNNQGTKGTSIKQGYTLLILSNRIKRMLLLLDTIDNDESFDMGRFVDLFKILVRNENRKYSLREFFSQGISYVAYQIAEQKGLKGGKYITISRKDYLCMLVSAMWGGLIICFVAVFKNLLGRLHYAHFWQGFWYSINYSLGFIAIDLTGSTLATKQPAFTANAVASSLDSKKSNGKPDMNNLAITVAKVIRSQTASFIGNLIIVFPGTYFLAMLYDKIFSEKISGGINAVRLLQEQHPFQSFSLLYACNTGFFLFLSGLIAGYVQNKIVYSKIGQRMVAQGTQSHNGSVVKKSKLAYFVEKHAGSIAGNASLGFFLGMAGILGKLFGIPFDIRHITISSGNMAIGVYGLGLENIPLKYLLTVFFGVLGIGFFNFLVSFSLAFFVAIKSRGIKLHQYPELLSTIVRYFFKRPLSFFFPSKTADSLG